MDRPITGFHRDADAHWVAKLSCGHAQHTRHDPPFQVREWVLSEAGRASRIGEMLDCVLCDRAQIPEDHAAYKRTPDFDSDSVPKGLLARHATKAGVWAQIIVTRGSLVVSMTGVHPQSQRLAAGDVGIMPPEVEHHVTPDAVVSFYVEFWRQQKE